MIVHMITSTSILRPRLGCGDGNADNPERLCDRPPKWGLGRTLANTDRDATTGYRERQEAMEPPINKSKRTLEAPSASFSLEEVQLPDPKRHAGARHAGSSHQTPGGGSGAAGAVL